VKEQQDEQKKRGWYDYNYDYVCGLESYCRAHTKASYEKVDSSLLTKRMLAIFNRCKVSPKADKLSTRSDKIRENLKLLALVTGSKAKFVEELTESCKITMQRAEEIYDDVKIDDPTVKQGAAVCCKKEVTNYPPPSSISILGPRDTKMRRRKGRKSRKSKALSKSYQANKERKNARKKREKQRTLTRKVAREAKFDWEDDWCRDCWDDDCWEEDQELHICYEAETTTAKKMDAWFHEVAAPTRELSRKENAHVSVKPHENVSLRCMLGLVILLRLAECLNYVMFMKQKRMQVE